jgi:hypothetical protein
VGLPALDQRALRERVQAGLAGVVPHREPAFVGREGDRERRRAVGDAPGGGIGVEVPAAEHGVPAAAARRDEPSPGEDQRPVVGIGACERGPEAQRAVEATGRAVGVEDPAPAAPRVRDSGAHAVGQRGPTADVPRRRVHLRGHAGAGEQDGAVVDEVEADQRGPEVDARDRREGDAVRQRDGAPVRRGKQHPRP